MRIEDYALIGDTQTAALVGRDGSIDWFCAPRFDSAAPFAALLGDPGNGRWKLAPASAVVATTRRYRDDTLVLETEMRTAEGTVRVVDAMPIRGRYPDIVRVVEGVSGSVAMTSELVLRFDYGHVVPWVRKGEDGRLHATAGADALVLASPVPMTGRERSTVAEFTVHAGDRVPFVLTWHPSFEDAPAGADAMKAIPATERWWREWISRADVHPRYRNHVVRSLLTLKALTYAPTGGIVAAATASLPEALGGQRNWDYRFCWLRDATFTLYAMLHAGYKDEARAWRDWLLRALAGDPRDLQIMYGPAGERRVEERVLEWLPGYEGSSPVRIGNAAAGQLQLDVYGEVLDALHQARRMGLDQSADAWAIQKVLCDWLESNWQSPDDGIWEMRGKRSQYTHSKVMAWVAFDRAVKAVEQHGMTGPVDRWQRARDAVHRDACDNGFDARAGAFTQSYGSSVLDASLLLIPSVGFLPPDDPRFTGTVAAIERTLTRDGFVLRYPDGEDGMKGTEGAFLACSFWLVDAYVLMGRVEDARALFERVLGVANDVGLLAEEYDTSARRMVGNFPQAFSHVGLINSARGLTNAGGAARARRET
jgi:GH15 family glucan-1,4-alpha-glucosidase